MTTPNPVSQHRRAEPVPQWCYDAAEEIIGHRATYIAAIIARHAPQAEPPQPAHRYACSKLAAVGDTVKVLGSEPPLIMKVEEISTTGGLYIKSLTGTACMLLNSSQVEFVPEIPPAGEAAVWPRYFRLCEDGNWRWVQYKPDLPLLYKKFDGSMTNADVNIEELMNRNDAIETDAHGNALQKHDASVPTREWISKMADGEEKCASVSARSPDAFEKQEASGVEVVSSNIMRFDNGKGKYVKAVRKKDHDRVVREKDATIAELRAQQLTLARDYDPNCDEFDFAYQREVMKSASRIIDAAQGLAQSLGRDPEGCLVTACECAVEVIDERDILKEELKELRTRAEAAEAEVAQLDTQNGEVCCHGYAPYTPADYEVLVARAEAAEAEVARLHKIVGDCELVAFDNCNPPQLWSWIGDWEGGAAEPLQRIKNARDAVKEIADLTAQLAAANERVAALEKERDRALRLLNAAVCAATSRRFYS